MTETITTPAGDVALQEYRLGIGGREWGILHTDAVLSYYDEAEFLSTMKDRVPYGVALWPAAIALAHEIAARADMLRGARVLELGAGTGLPGIVAASLGARVVQTDRQALALDVCRRNGARNGVAGIEHRQADWAEWADDARYDLILGADVLYAERTHPFLRAIFDRNLAPSGRLLLSDPYRQSSIAILGAMEAAGWRVSFAKWTVGEADDPRPIGMYELAPPPRG